MEINFAKAEKNTIYYCSKEVEGELTLLIYAHQMDLRYLPEAAENALASLFCLSRTFTVFLKKDEKGVNLIDFKFLNRVQAYGRIHKGYTGVEKYWEYLPGLVVIYIDYHKYVSS